MPRSAVLAYTISAKPDTADRRECPNECAERSQADTGLGQANIELSCAAESPARSEP